VTNSRTEVSRQIYGLTMAERMSTRWEERNNRKREFCHRIYFPYNWNWSLDFPSATKTKEV